MPRNTPRPVASSAINAVTRVNAYTKTRSKKSSSGVTREPSVTGRMLAGRPPW